MPKMEIFSRLKQIEAVLKYLGHFAQVNVLNLYSTHYIRLLVMPGLLLRFSLREYQILGPVLTIFFVYSLLSFIFIFTNSHLLSARKWILFQLFADTTIFSLLYLYTGNGDSDIFLLYFLPLLLASEQLRLREATVYFFVLSFCFLAITLILPS